MYTSGRRGRSRMIDLNDMAASYFFYDLETSGFDPKVARVMQFAGQRTDLELKPIGEPVNVMIKLTPDVLPDPDAVMLTGITPQATITDGLTEAEFLKYFYDEVVQPDTIFLGFNSVRFDDEFMRYLHYRNFYDPYEWQWQNGSSRWDVLDLVRMTRALRPEGIEWPVDADGKPTNRLELLTKVNKLDHDHAHDALSDVMATIAITRLIKEKQPDLYDYLMKGRSKQAVKELVLKGQPFVYTTGRYSSQYLHTTAAILLARHTGQDAALVYDLRVDPTPFAKMTVPELIEAWRYNPDPAAVRLPIKTLKYNRCPAVAPMGVIKDQAVQDRLQLPIAEVTKNLQRLRALPELAEKISEAVAEMDKTRFNEQQKTPVVQVDARLYDGFLQDGDKATARAVRAAKPEELTDVAAGLKDERLQQLAPLYKARNYPASLDSDERAAWDDHVKEVLLGGGKDSRAAKYFMRLQELAKGDQTSQQQYLLEELQLYGESILPTDVAD